MADSWGDRVCCCVGVSDSSCRCGRLRAQGCTAPCSQPWGPRQRQLHLNPLRLAEGSAGLGPATFSKHLLGSGPGEPLMTHGPFLCGL